MLDLIRRRYDPQWEDMSDYVVHFTKATRESNCAFNMESMLLAGEISARRKYGVGRYYPHCPECVCLSETPIHNLSRIKRLRGSYGFGFSKDFIIRSGGGPLFYTTNEIYEAVSTLMGQSRSDPAAPIWVLAPFIDVLRNNYQFDWEREWRVPHSLAFGPQDISFMLFPEEEHKDFSDYRLRKHAEGAMPLYDCPLIDHRWQQERIREVLSDVKNTH
jgi:hypothetical protein